MNGTVFYPAGDTPAGRYAAEKLTEQGISFVPSPGPDVTHLLLPVPSFDSDGRIRGGGNIWNILRDLPEEITVVGGNLQHPALEGFSTIDLLQDPTYLAQNAWITAECALSLAAARLPILLRQCPTLVIGWGRIGKCLAQLLKGTGASVTVAARKETDRAMLCALGFGTFDIAEMVSCLSGFRLVFNTVPAPVISEDQSKRFRPDCIRIDLASRPGIGGESVIPARGLPGKDAPEASGNLIADTVLRKLAERRQQP